MCCPEHSLIVLSSPRLSGQWEETEPLITPNFCMWLCVCVCVWWKACCFSKFPDNETDDVSCCASASWIAAPFLNDSFLSLSPSRVCRLRVALLAGGQERWGPPQARAEWRERVLGGSLLRQDCLLDGRITSGCFSSCHENVRWFACTSLSAFLLCYTPICGTFHVTTL